MLRHTAFFLFREDITPAQHLAMLKGLAYMRFECRSVVALDYGTDLFGGSDRCGRPSHGTARPGGAPPRPGRRATTTSR